MRGALEERDVKISCSKIWADADLNTTITVRIPAADNFRFSAGGLWSDWLPGEETVHYYHKVTEGGPPVPILSGDLREWRIGQFCVRAICNVTKSSTRRGVMLKCTILLHPGNADEILECSSLSQQPSWPGIKLQDSEIPLKPHPSRLWQCPVMPFLIPGTPFAELAVAPPGNKLRHAIAAIMCKTGAADCYRSVAPMQEKVEKLRRNPGEGAMKKPAIYWPAPLDLPADEGRHSFQHNICITRTQKTLRAQT
jgi:hypothetical protein